MMKRLMMICALAAILPLASTVAAAADKAPDQEKVQPDRHERVHASQLMTRQERDDYRAKKHNAKTAEEKDRVRKEHNDRMKARAKERAAAAKPATPTTPATPVAPVAPAAPAGQ
jgi:hypothetical protein